MQAQQTTPTKKNQLTHLIPFYSEHVPPPPQPLKLFTKFNVAASVPIFLTNPLFRQYTHKIRSPLKHPPSPVSLEYIPHYYRRIPHHIAATDAASATLNRQPISTTHSNRAVFPPSLFSRCLYANIYTYKFSQLPKKPPDSLTRHQSTNSM